MIITSKFFLTLLLAVVFFPPVCLPGTARVVEVMES